MQPLSCPGARHTQSKAGCEHTAGFGSECHHCRTPRCYVFPIGKLPRWDIKTKCRYAASAFVGLFINIKCVKHKGQLCLMSCGSFMILITVEKWQTNSLLFRACSSLTLFCCLTCAWGNFSCLCSGRGVILFKWRQWSKAFNDLQCLTEGVEVVQCFSSTLLQRWVAMLQG